MCGIWTFRNVQKAVFYERASSAHLALSLVKGKFVGRVGQSVSWESWWLVALVARARCWWPSSEKQSGKQLSNWRPLAWLQAQAALGRRTFLGLHNEGEALQSHYFSGAAPFLLRSFQNFLNAEDAESAEGRLVSGFSLPP